MYSESEHDQGASDVSAQLDQLAAGKSAAPLKSRRAFLAGSAAFGVWALGATSFIPLARAANEMKSSTGTGLSAAETGFLNVSTFVTAGKKLDPTIGQRFYAGLAKRDAGFAAKVTALQTYIDQQKLADMDAFMAVPNLDPAMKAAAQHIVAAWYLGVVGDGADAELITYADSLMYVPTRGILAVPTYGPGPLAWGPKPESKSAYADSTMYASRVRTGESNEQL